MKVPHLKRVLYLFFLVLSTHVWAQEDIWQKIIPKGTSGNIKQVFYAIESQSNLKFSYKSSDLDLSLHFKIQDSSTVEHILNSTLGSVNLTYSYAGNAIVLVKKKVIATTDMLISGFVIDKESYNRLVGAYVFDLNSKQFTYTNEEGFFALHLPADTTTLKIMYVGFVNGYLEIKKLKSKLYNVYLEQGPQLSEALVIKDGDSGVFEQNAHSITLDKDIQSKMPSILGQGDLFNNIGLLPGVHSLRDVSPGVVVRGGGPDQNLILMDGVPIYNPTHLFGLISVFNPDIVQQIKLYKDAFPSNFGGRLSSILDVKTRSGNVNNFKVKINTGMIASGVILEGPIQKGKSSFLLAARRSYTDVLIKGYDAVTQTKNPNPAFFFYDINLKVQHRFNSHSYLNGGVYFGADRGVIGSKLKIADSTELKEETKTSIDWNTKNAFLRWSYTPKGFIFNNLSVFYTNYQLKFSDEYDLSRKSNNETNYSKYRYTYRSGIEDIGIKNETDFGFKKHQFKAGGQLVYHNFNPGRNTYAYASSSKNSLDTSAGIVPINSAEATLFVHYKTQIKQLNLETGLQQAFYLVDERFSQVLQPRFSAIYSFKSKGKLLLDFSRMAQFIHLLPNNNLGIPNDLWLPTTGNLKPFTSNQWSLGYQFKLNHWSFNTDAYSKKQFDILEFRDGANIVLAASNWENELTQGSGTIRGLEQLIKYDNKKLAFWVSYAISKSDRIFTELNDGNPFPFKYDRRHQVATAFIYAFNPKWSLSANWVFLSGNPVTIPEDKFVLDLEGQQYPIELINERNNYRMPAYHRLDISCKKNIQKAWGNSQLILGVFNVYNHYNPYFLFFGFNEKGQQVLKQRSLLPIVPSISYIIEFK